MSLRCTCAGSSLKLLGVVRQMIRYEGGDERVAMVIARMPAQCQWLARQSAGRLKTIRMQLISQEFISQALVDKNVAWKNWPRTLAHQGAGVMLKPARFVSAKVAGKRLAAP